MKKGEKKQNLVGQKFNKLTVLRKTNRQNKEGKYLWECQCECGELVYLITARTKTQKSCGCARGNSQTTHGMTRTKIYAVWGNMRDRCNNPNNPAYHHYGGKGIKVCDEWKNDFMTFYIWSIDNGYKEIETENHGEKMSIDRIDSDGDYKPSNCQWITISENAKRSHANMNERDCVTLYTYNGKSMNLKDWSRELGIGYMTLRQRLKNGWSLEEAFGDKERKEKLGKTLFKQIQ